VTSPGLIFSPHPMTRGRPLPMKFPGCRSNNAHKRVHVGVLGEVGGPLDIEWLPEGVSSSPTHFCDTIIPALAHAFTPRGGGIQRSRHPLRLDSASWHSSKPLWECIKHDGLTMLPQPPHSPAIALCDFFLFGAGKQKLNHIQGLTQKWLFDNLERTLGDFPSDTSKSGSQAGRRDDNKSLTLPAVTSHCLNSSAPHSIDISLQAESMGNCATPCRLDMQSSRQSWSAWLVNAPGRRSDFKGSLSVGTTFSDAPLCTGKLMESRADPFETVPTLFPRKTAEIASFPGAVW
jgi:hypothetical protein